MLPLELVIIIGLGGVAVELEVVVCAGLDREEEDMIVGTGNWGEEEERGQSHGR